MSVVAEKGGGSIVKQYYSHCISKAIESIFPELTWYPWMHKTGIHSNLTHKNTPLSIDQKKMSRVVEFFYLLDVECR
jgi:hypothetical protein